MGRVTGSMCQTSTPTLTLKHSDLTEFLTLRRHAYTQVHIHPDADFDLAEDIFVSHSIDIGHNNSKQSASRVKAS